MQLHGATEPPHGLEAQADSLGRLSWMYLRLLLARRMINQVLGGARQDVDLQQRIASLERQQAQPGLSDELARSIGGQLEILRQRLEAAHRGRPQARLHRGGAGRASSSRWS
jgi:hypothetical protein